MYNYDEKNRQNWIDLIKGISIISVIYYHTSIDNCFINFITSFHMFIFFFLSGYLFDAKKYQILPKNKYMCGKLKSLLLPYVIFIVLYSMINFLFIKQTISNCLYNLLFSNLYFGAIWFLPSLLLCIIMSNFIISSYSNRYYLIVAFSLVLFMLGIFAHSNGFYNVFRYQQSLVSCIYYCSGYICKEYIIKKQNMYSLKYITMTSIFLLGIGFIGSQINSRIILSRMMFGDLALCFVTSFSNILGLCLFVKMCYKERFLETLNSIVLLLGKYSIIVLCTHEILLSLFRRIVPVNLNIQLKAILLSILVVCLEYFIIKNIPLKMLLIFGMNKKK